PPHDLLPIMEAAPGVLVENLDPLGQQGWLRMNHLHPPFDDVRIRQAVLWMINQADYLQAVIGNPAYYGICPAYFGCGTPLESDVAAEALMSQDLDKARALIAEAGYDGTPVVILQATDIPINNGAALVTAQILREIGMNVELQAMDWSTLTSRRAISKPVDEGGWNIFITWWIGADILNPVANIGVSGGCRNRAWFGWPCDEEIERLRDAYAREADPAEQKRLADAVQRRAFEIVTYANFGEWFNPIAYSERLKGMIKSPVQFFWNIEKQ
ncbi:MAG TPA: ABC transporter substrate-binding protein, partial [Alphaproteobacteria bacterium]|nr:ABC transporter substrate-binding protein [Alphaproteobacteria bacterium]